MLEESENVVDSLIRGTSVAYLGTVSEEGRPEIKALATQRALSDIKTHYFVSSLYSRHVKHLERTTAASLYFSDVRFFRSVMLEGVCSIERDISSFTQIEQDTLKGSFHMFSGGGDDMCLIVFHALKGRYYCNTRSEDFVLSSVLDEVGDR